MGHTPGPWHIEFECNVFSESHRLVASAGGYQTNAEGDRHRLENEANARRIVACVNACEGINPEAVPDLLAALEPFAYLARVMEDGQMLNFRGVYISFDQAQAAQAAIAKARGESCT